MTAKHMLVYYRKAMWHRLEKEVRLLNDQQTNGDPWIGADARYLPGQQVRGQVTRLTQFGVFVEIEPGLEGILYAFEVGTGPGALGGFVRGQELQLYVKNRDVSRRRLELSLQHGLMPGLLEESALPPDLLRHAPAVSERQTGVHPLLTGEELRCQSCQRAVRASWRYCVYCGGSLQRICATCGALQADLPDARYCWSCGQSVASSMG
jgi:hypothetical protein